MTGCATQAIVSWEHHGWSCVHIRLVTCRGFRESEIASRESAAAGVAAAAEERRREAEAWESRMRKVGQGQAAHMCKNRLTPAGTMGYGDMPHQIHIRYTILFGLDPPTC